MTDNLNFKVSSELKNILGRDLITSPDIAILELVKNSYDAHATNVKIIFDEDYLCIADNGKGMTKSDLVNKWLFVAYSAKSDGTEDISYRSKIKRHYAGAKGIGRMSCDRLAKKLTLTTRSSKENKTEILHVDWSVFEHDKLTEFDTVNIPHETVDYIPNFPLNKHTGTILEFHNLNVSWSRYEILRLKKSLEKMINPFSGTDDEFQIEIIAPKMSEEDDKINSTYEKINGTIKNTIADVLKIKTTQIESRIENGIIYTTLSDRGIKMYEIEESNIKFSMLSSVSVSLFFLNRAAKYNFTAKMGIEPVNYGNVFLFRNGFRIFPFGEYDDDSWGLNQRQQQGYNRRLGTRDLFGRVDVETDDVDLIKEVSSRDGGLIKTIASQQLMDYFSDVHKKLERYVVGVLWGEGFLRKDYFVNQNAALQARDQLKEIDKDQDSANHLYANIGSRVDFMQLIRSLVNDNSVKVNYYNEELSDIVSNSSDVDLIQNQMFDDFRRVAEKTNDSILLNKISDFERRLEDMRRQKEDAERKAKEEQEMAIEARKKVQEEERKRIEEEQKRKAAEQERDVQIKRNKYLEATRNTSKDVLDLLHTVLISSNDAISLINTAKFQLANKDYAGLRMSLDSFDYDINRIHLLAKMITKADLTLLSESKLINIEGYIKEYFSNYKPSYNVQYHSTITEVLEKKIPILDLSIVLDNLMSNSEKAGATEFRVDFSRNNRTFIFDFTDNGEGVDLNQFTSENIFEEGVTNRRGGSGIGLNTIKNKMINELNGDIQFVGNGLYYKTGATFRLFFQ